MGEGRSPEAARDDRQAAERPAARPRLRRAGAGIGEAEHPRRGDRAQPAPGGPCLGRAHPAPQRRRRAAQPPHERDAGPAARPVPGDPRRWRDHAPGLHPVPGAACPSVPGEDEGRRRRGGGAGLALRRAASLSRPLLGVGVARRSPDAAGARVRRPVPSALLSAARAGDDPAPPLRAERCVLAWARCQRSCTRGRRCRSRSSPGQ
ncbi:hypothetical protein Ae406Ps2_5572 [Pseudonocardia sp. Ae406_Ps2]|nr:hypothetical protein Ae406Ps2_5572 [Pseudonocardia sp. Ae406_Ps2]